MNEELNLDNIKVGDEITIIIPQEKGIKYGWVYIITEWDDRHKKWRYALPSKPEKNHGWFPLTGHGYAFMSKRKTPDFYYSANPKHIKNAKKALEVTRIKQAKKEAEQARRIALALPIGNLLKTEYYDSEENYHLDTTLDITEILVSKLSDEQITTLKTWLGV